LTTRLQDETGEAAGGALRALFNDAEGTLSPLIFSDPAIYERELERVFARSWLVVAHEGHLPTPGSYFASYMAEDPVIVVRQKDGSVKVLLNQCRHRGMKLCRTDAGQARGFTCSYHGWAYDLAGNLVNVPLQDLAFPTLDKAQWGVRQARVEIYKGLIFATWSPDAPPLREFLGDAAYYLDCVLDRSAEGFEPIGGVFKWRIPCNWKFAAEQFASDMYHATFSHSSPQLAMEFEGPRPDPAQMTGGQFRGANGHGCGFFLTDIQWGFRTAQSGERVDDFDPAAPLARTTAQLGLPRALMTAQHMTVFPNFSMLSTFDTFRIWHPRGPGETEVWAWGMVDKAATAAEREQARLSTLRTFSPAGTWEQDDGENWVEIQRVLRGAQARKTVFNAQMGQGRPAHADPAFPGAIDTPYAEEAARGFYAHWQAMMADASTPAPAEASGATR
jgi:phenylpropionate dioxygenase-like ring-hydroxylating dioxygenase large terminal subunit